MCLTNLASIFEHEPSMDEMEEAWLITMDKIDPAGYISKLANILCMYGMYCDDAFKR